jgi:hypothetical protein
MLLETAGDGRLWRGAVLRERSRVAQARPSISQPGKCRAVLRRVLSDVGSGEEEFRNGKRITEQPTDGSDDA